MFSSLKNITILYCFCPTRQNFISKSFPKHANEVHKTVSFFLSKETPWRIPCFSRTAVSYEHPWGCTNVSKAAFNFMEYSPFPSLLCTKLTFKSSQLQKKAERLEALTDFWVKTSCLKNDIHVFCWLNLPKRHWCSSGNMRSIRLAATKGPTLSALCKRWWELITGLGGTCNLSGAGISQHTFPVLLEKHEGLVGINEFLTQRQGQSTIGGFGDLYISVSDLMTVSVGHTNSFSKKGFPNTGSKDSLLEAQTYSTLPEDRLFFCEGMPRELNIWC